MIDSDLASERAVAVNIEITRTFVRVRELATTHHDLTKRLAEIELKTESLELQHDTFSHNTRNQLREVFKAIHALTMPPEPPKRPIGFVTHEDKPAPKARKSLKSVKGQNVP